MEESVALNDMHVTVEKGGDHLKNSTEFVVREAIPEDCPIILFGAEVFWKESVYSHMTFDEEKMWDRIITYMTMEDKRLFILSHEGSPAGALFASLGPTFCGIDDDLLAFEETCYVLPEARSQGGFALLLDAFEAWALGAGAKALVFDITSQIKTRRTEEKLEARGYEYAGATLVKRI